ncbi:GGDEF domain-containing protein [Flocculibacter collagenilyticus]|uniref:GGDEF domain-containing protein n=1 Tax=Flocculibacter collagenilyticus TaxID=2744479 RepID=UPI0018F7974A|nr:GGDEF domain-containing protein [Flocculibacter collagenilyticus]
MDKSSQELLLSLSRLVKTMHDSDSIHRMLVSLQAEIRSQLHFNDVWLYLFKESDPNKMELIDFRGEHNGSHAFSDENKSERFQAIQTVDIKDDKWLEEVFSSDTPVFTADARTESRMDKSVVDKMGIVSLLNGLVCLGQEQFGVLCTGSFDDATPITLSKEQLSYFSVLTSLLAVNINRVQSIYLTDVDPLTQINNRKGFVKVASKQLKMATRDKCSVAIVAINIKNFSSVNAKYGHHIGDQVLVHFAAKLSSIIRDSDEAAREAGDCFLLSLYGVSDALSVQHLINKVHFNCNKINFEGVMVHLEFEINFAMFPNDDKELEALIELATNQNNSK